MSTQGYTRRDHRHRKKYSKRRSEILLDRLLKIFFYILVILVVIIVIKVAVGGKDDAKETTKDTGNKTTTTSGKNEDDDSTTPNESGSSDAGSDTSSSTSEKDSEDASDDTTTTKDDTTEEQSTEETTTTYTAKGDYSLFDNSAFVGDSRVGGLYLSSQLITSTFYYDVGGNVSSAVSSNTVPLDNGSDGTMIDALKQKQFENIFIQYGVNEWGWNTSSFISKYENLISEIKKVQPNANIYVMAIIPVTAEYAEERADGAMNVNLKLDEMDAELKKMAENNGIGYINVVEAITGGERVLASNMSSDGYHLNRSYNLRMLDYICEIIE